MSSQPLPLRALWRALGVTAYVVIIALVVTNSQSVIGPINPGILGPIAFLLTFVFSVLVTGSLVLLSPIRLYLDGQKTEGIRLLIYTAGWLGAFTLLTLAVMVLIYA